MRLREAHLCPPSSCRATPVTPSFGIADHWGTLTDTGVIDRARLSDEQRLDWLRLIRSDNVGPRTFRALIDHCGNARTALKALPELARRGGASRPARVYSIEQAERELRAARALGATFIALGEPD